MTSSLPGVVLMPVLTTALSSVPGARAAVAWFHPGGFTEGDKANEADLATDLARRGYVVFVVDYTLNPKLQWFDMAGRVAAARVADHEASAAIAWIKHRAAQYGVDPSL